MRNPPWHQRLFARLVEVPEPLYSDPTDRWRARAILIFLLANLTIAVLLCMHLPFLTPATQARAARLVPMVIVSLLMTYGLIRWVPGGMTLAAWLNVPVWAIWIVVYCVRGNGIFDPNMPGCYWLLALTTLLAGAPATAVVIVVSVLILGVLGWCTRAGLLRGELPPMPPSVAEFFSISAAGSVVIVGVTLIFLDLLHRSLRRRAVEHTRLSEAARQQADRLAEMDRMKSAFISNVSHELRTPLTLSLGALEECLDDRETPLPPVHRERLEMARRNGRRLQRLVVTLLDLSRLEVGRLRAACEPVDLAGLTADLAGEFRSAVERAGLRLLVDCPPLPGSASVDHGMWEKIVFNLLSNALKFTRSGEIAVTLREVAGWAELSVRDTGCGMDAEEVAQLFRRFQPLRPRWARSYEGAGLGLSLVRELVQLHGGAIHVESAPGRGSSFTVRVPLGPAARPEEPEERRPPPPAEPQGRLYIEEAMTWLGEGAWEAAPAELAPAPEAAPAEPAAAAAPLPGLVLVEDNADMRAYLSRLLRPRFAVRAFDDGERALRVAREAPPDLMLLDVMMPGLDGLALLRALRQDPGLRALPIVLLSARAEEEAALEALSQGADDYVIKPFSPRELLARLEAHLELGRLRRQTAAEKDLFTRCVIHELRGPLMIVKGYAQLLRVQAGDRSDRPMLDSLLHGVGRIESLVDDLVDLVRLQVGQLRLARAACDLGRLCAAAAAHAEAASGRVVAVALPGAEVVVEADERRLEQVLLNLIGNALKFSPLEGSVELALQVVGREAEVVVRDRGPGLDEEELAGLFARPFHGAERRGSAGRGLGLGLYLCRELIQRSGGRLAVKSDPGRGSAFSITLPLAEQRERGAA